MLNVAMIFLGGIGWGPTALESSVGAGGDRCSYICDVFYWSSLAVSWAEKNQLSNEKSLGCLGYIEIILCIFRGILINHYTRWAPTSYKWSYNSYKWPKING